MPATAVQLTTLGCILVAIDRNFCIMIKINATQAEAYYIHLLKHNKILLSMDIGCCYLIYNY